jgi:aryl-alcohol dehydrogenase-like predicted oxidoreductase
VTAPIASATNLDQLREILRGVEIRLGAEAVEALAGDGQSRRTGTVQRIVKECTIRANVKD